MFFMYSSVILCALCVSVLKIDNFIQHRDTKHTEFHRENEFLCVAFVFFIPLYSY